MGKVAYNSTTVFEKLNSELKTCDFVVGLHPNEGIGTNIVLGIAAGRKKPLIIILDKNFDMDSLPGLMYQGFKEITKCEIIVYNGNEEPRKN